MSTHNICFRGEIRKILCGYPILSVAMEIRKIPMMFGWKNGLSAAIFRLDYTSHKICFGTKQLKIIFRIGPLFGPILARNRQKQHKWADWSWLLQVYGECSCPQCIFIWNMIRNWKPRPVAPVKENNLKILLYQNISGGYSFESSCQGNTNE